MEYAFEKTLDRIAGSPTTGKPAARIINHFVDDFLGTGNEMEQRVLTRLRKNFKFVHKISCILYRTKNTFVARFPKRAVHWN